MSSTEFEVTLHPDRTLRKVVCCSGVVLAVTGLLLILTMNVAAGLRALLAVAWLADCLWELRQWTAGAGRVHALTLYQGGSVIAAGPRGRRPVTLLTGSRVGTHAAWLRLRLPGGRRHAEFLIASRMDAGSWHRLQLLWRQCRAAFGQTARP